MAPSISSIKEKILRRKSKRELATETNGDTGPNGYDAGEKVSPAERPFTPLGPTRISLEHSAFHVSSGTRRPNSNPRPSTGHLPKPAEPVPSQHRRVVSLEERKPRAEDAIPMRSSSKRGVRSTPDEARIRSSFESKPETASYTTYTIGSSNRSQGRGSLERQEDVVGEIIPQRASSKHATAGSPVSPQMSSRPGFIDSSPHAMIEEDPRMDHVPNRTSSLHYVYDNPVSRITTTITTTTTTTSPTAATSSSPSSPIISTSPTVTTTTTTTPPQPRSRRDRVIIDDGAPGPSRRDPRSRKPLPNSATRLPEYEERGRTRRGSSPSAQLAELNLQRTRELHDTTIGSSPDSAPLHTKKELPPVPPVPPIPTLPHMPRIPHQPKDLPPLPPEEIPPPLPKETPPLSARETPSLSTKSIPPLSTEAVPALPAKETPPLSAKETALPTYKPEISEHIRLPPGFDLQNTEQTHVSEEWRPAVTHENIIKQRTEIIQEEITRDIHMHHYFTYLQPIKVVEILPPKHFLLDLETGVKTEIPAPSGWTMPVSMKPVSPDASMLKTWTRHYLVNEEHPLGVPELPPLKHEPAFEDLRQEAKVGGP